MNSSRKLNSSNADVDAGDLRDAGQRLRTEEAIEQRVGFGVIGEILVDRDFGEIGTEHVGAGLQHDGDQRN